MVADPTCWVHRPHQRGAADTHLYRSTVVEPISVGHAVAVPVEDNRGVEALAQRVRVALESADLSQFGELLDPHVRWGAPDDPAPSCQTRSDVLAWYGRGRASGRRARVVDVQVHRDKILVHLRLISPSSTSDATVESDRWQVLTCARGRVVDIRGFETSDEAFARITPTR
jgi:hypothetical protein